MNNDDSPRAFDLHDALAFLRRRGLAIGVVWFALALLSVAVAGLWPPTYRSTATILVEEQEIPQDLVRSTVTSYADQRIQVIGQQVMTRAHMLQIVDKYGLYAKRRKTETTEETLERLRRDVRVDVVSADVSGPGGGRRVTIAFNLSYDGEDAESAQRVANELVTLYLNENLKIRQQKAAETTSFLAEEAKRLEEHIGAVEARLAQFKRRNMGRLPELAQLNMQLRERVQGDLADVDGQLRLAQERRFYLESQLALTKPNAPPTTASGERVPLPEDKLRALKSQYDGMKAIYTDNHPDILRARREMAALEPSAGGEGASEAQRAAEIARLEQQVAALKERYSDEHPDVVRARKAIEALRATDAAQRVAEPVRRDKPDNPLYLSLDTQIKVIDAEAANLRGRREELLRKLSGYERALLETPQVEQEYLDLARDRENSVVRYREMKAKSMEAEVAQALEKDRKGERFSLIDPPQRPEKPRTPNRPLILALGIVAALGGGIGYGGLREALDRSIKSPAQLQRTFQAPLFSVIEHIETAEERRQRHRRRILLRVAILGALLALVAAVHFFYMPLEVLWYSALRHLQGTF